MKLFKTNLAIFFVIFMVGLAPYFPFITEVYLASILSREVIIFLLSYLLMVNVSYEQIASKCVILGFAITQFFNLLQNILYSVFYFNEDSLDILIYINIVIFSASLLMSFHLARRYKYSTDSIDEFKIYYLCPKVDDITGLMSALYYVPFGGVKVLCNGCVYSYRKGVLIKSQGRKADFYIKKCLAFDTGFTHSPSIQRELESMVGDKWTFRHNCYRTFEPMFGSLKSKLKD